MRGSAEPVKAEPFWVAAFTQCAKADQSGAQQRSSGYVLESVGNGKTKTRIGHGKVGVTAINVVAGEACAIAKIFTTGPAELTFTTRPAQPRNADPIALAKSFYIASNFFDASHDFVSGNQRQLRGRQFAIDNVKIGAADGAGGNAQEDLPGIRSWFENVAQLQLLFGRIEYHCAHNEQNSGRFSALSRTRSEPDWRLDAPRQMEERSSARPGPCLIGRKPMP